MYYSQQESTSLTLASIPIMEKDKLFCYYKQKQNYKSLANLLNKSRIPSAGSYERQIPEHGSYKELFSPDAEVPNEFSSTFSLSNSSREQDENISSVNDNLREAWEMNYHEAAIYLEVHINLFHIALSYSCYRRKDSIMKNSTATHEVEKLFHHIWSSIIIGSMH